MANHILRHMIHVRRHVLQDQPQTCDVVFHLIVENNYAQAGRSIYEAVARVEADTRRQMVLDGMKPLVIDMYHEEDSTGDTTRRSRRHRAPESHLVGFFTNNARKETMVEDTKRALCHRNVKFHERFFTLRTDAMTSDQMRDGWFKQMVHFGYVEVTKGDSGSLAARKRPRIDDPVVYRVYSGKSSSAGGNNDDRVMATMIAYYAALEIEERRHRRDLEAIV